MLVDIIIIIILLFAVFIGYIRGFYKELYSLIALIISIVSAYFFSMFISGDLFRNIKIGDLPDMVVNIIIDYVIPGIVIALLSLFVFIIVKIIISILIKKELIPSEKILRPIGSVINLTVTIFLLTYLALVVSVTEMANDFDELQMLDIYSDSKLVDVLLDTNPFVKKINNNIKSTYQNAMIVVDGFNGEELSDEEIDAMKELLKTDIAEDMVVEASKEIIKEIEEEGGELNFEDAPIDELTEAVKESDMYSTMKELYDEGVLTDELITRIIEENNIKGLSSEDVINMFK